MKTSMSKHASGIELIKFEKQRIRQSDMEHHKFWPLNNSCTLALTDDRPNVKGSGV